MGVQRYGRHDVGRALLIQRTLKFFCWGVGVRKDALRHLLEDCVAHEGLYEPVRPEPHDGLAPLLRICIISNILEAIDKNQNSNNDSSSSSSNNSS